MDVNCVSRVSVACGGVYTYIVPRIYFLVDSVERTLWMPSKDSPSGLNGREISGCQSLEKNFWSSRSIYRFPYFLGENIAGRRSNNFPVFRSNFLGLVRFRFFDFSTKANKLGACGCEELHWNSLSSKLLTNLGNKWSYRFPLK